MNPAARRLAATGVGAALLLGLAAGEPAAPVTPKTYWRAPEQTYLTYPEWFLVFSPAEYAAFVQTAPPSEFPFLGHIGQFWQGYRAIWGATRKAYPVNWGYHVMIVVIGVSTTAEYGLRSAYETLVGRLSELTTGDGRTEEDALGARVAQEYVDFIRVEPWYRFDFVERLVRLWRECPLFGARPLRKWERRYALTTEYGAKVLYGWLIRKLTEVSYEAERTDTAALVSALPPGLETEIADLKVLDRLPDGSVLTTLPRYEAFKDRAALLANRGVRFVEIAGNRGVILVSALGPHDFRPDPKLGTLLFAQPILTVPGRRRIVLEVKVDGLDTALRELGTPPLQVEHVYDY